MAAFGTQIDRFHLPMTATATAASRSRTAFEDWLVAAGARADVVHELTVDTIAIRCERGIGG